MSFESGWAALSLEKPREVPRVEYSADFHWDLIERVTGEGGLGEKDEDARRQASRRFTEEWDYAFIWSTLISGDDLGPWRTRMGHAEYQAQGADFDSALSNPFTTPEQVLAFQPMEQLPPFELKATRERFEAHYRGNKAAFPNAVAMTGIYITCVSGLIDLLGWDMLLEALSEDPEEFGALTERYGNWIDQAYQALAASDVPVVMVHDDLVWTTGPFVHPDWYRRYVFPQYRRMIGRLREAGKKIIFTADGCYTQFLDDIAEAGVHGFVMEPTTDMALVAEKFGQTHFFVGNADTRILLSGKPQDIEGEVERCMAIGKECPGYILAVGNHIPPNTPVENALIYDRAYRRLRGR